MNYKAENVDTDKALEFIEECRKISYQEEHLEKTKIDSYYAGYRKGLEVAESIFDCSNYEKQEDYTNVF